MDFSSYPFDGQKCEFSLGSFANPIDIINLTGTTNYESDRQRWTSFEESKNDQNLATLYIKDCGLHSHW